MKTIFTLLSLGFFIQSYSQERSANRFEEADQEFNRQQEGNWNSAKDHEVAYSGGNPADPAPIDDYLPLLFVTATGIIIYTIRKKNKALS
ncbi:hypothetical protein [Kaistella palustris]|uniref:hypothetical protein n=1 Tax=Kaistella palustris TaxID=493376 RepID=UPI00048042E6|nr:hypothetical protein [Kaistella palustris]